MKGKDFFNSKWMKKGATPEGQKKIKDDFEHWSGRVKNSGLLTRAKQLYQFFLSSEITGTQKILVVAALLYIITPVDIVPDFFPIIGWLDDIGVAGFALNYIFAKMDKMEQNELEKQQKIDELLERDIEGTSFQQFRASDSDKNEAILVEAKEEKSSFFKEK